VDIPEESITKENVQMTQKPRRTFTDEQKAEAVRTHLEVEMTGCSQKQTKNLNRPLSGNETLSPRQCFKIIARGE
jgi:hypothetical protein